MTLTCGIFSLTTLDERNYANYCKRKVKVNNKKVRLFTMQKMLFKIDHVVKYIVFVFILKKRKAFNQKQKKANSV